MRMSLRPIKYGLNSHSMNLLYIYKEHGFNAIRSLCYLRLIGLYNSTASCMTSMYHVWGNQIIHSKRQFTYNQNVRPVSILK